MSYIKITFSKPSRNGEPLPDLWYEPGKLQVEQVLAWAYAEMKFDLVPIIHRAKYRDLVKYGADGYWIPCPNANGGVMTAREMHTECPMRKPMQQVLITEILSMMDETVQQKVLDLALEPATKGIILFENVDMWSSNLGHRSVLCFGPDRTCKSIEEIKGQHLGDVPSRFLYPQIYAINPFFKP